MLKASMPVGQSNSFDSPTLKGSILHGSLVLLFYTFIFAIFFSPVLFSTQLLAPGDGIIYYLPNFFSKRVFWEDLIWSGFPAIADAQVMMWYPLQLLFSLWSGAWNYFVVSAYVLASCFTYGYVYAITGSRLAGIVSGIVYGMCGVLMVHLGHTTIIHCAAWIPLIIWSLEMLRRKFSAFWVGIGSVAIACSSLAGHPQIFFYSMILSAAYALIMGWTARIGRWQYYGLFLLLLVFGAGLSAIQMLPTAELAAQTPRVHTSFSEFVTYSLPLRQIPTLLFPNLFGGSPKTIYGLPYFGAWHSGAPGGWGPTEIAGYVGLLPLMLAAVGVFSFERRALALFWLIAGLLAFLLVLGDATPVAALSFRVPLFNRFRVPGRHFIEMAFAVSVLSGMGVTAILRGAATNRLVLRTVSVVAVLMLVSLMALLLYSDQLSALAASKGIKEFTLLPWSNPATGVPLLIFLAAGGALIYWHRRPDSFLRSILLVLVLTLDVASYGWFCEWRYESPDRSLLSPPVPVHHYKDNLNNAHQRMLTVVGGYGSMNELPPNISKIWDVPNASGYGPFILSRMAQLLSMAPHGEVDASWRQPNNQALNLMAIRYVFVPRKDIEFLSPSDAREATWASDDMSLWLGSGCGTPRPDYFKLEFPAPVSASSIGIVSMLACSTGVPDGTEAVRVSLLDENGAIHSQSMLAGRDASEWAFDCSDVRPLVKHQRASIFKSFPVERGPVQCEGHDYVAKLSLNGPKNIKGIELRWVGPSGSVQVKKVSLIDEQTGRAYQIKPVSASLADSARWRHVENIGEASIYENLRAMPRAWLVPEVLSVNSEEAFKAIRLSQMSDGRPFDPSQIALVEEPLTFKAKTADPAATAQVVRAHDTRVEVQTSSTSPSFLVLSDNYYPGWEATIDGTATHLFRTNFALRGVLIPAGGHIVKFEFKPMTFYYGAAISMTSLLLLATLIFWIKRKLNQTT